MNSRLHVASLVDESRRLTGRARRMRDFAMPNQCALCGNLSHGVLCHGCDETYWNEPRLRCEVCAAATVVGPPRPGQASALRGLHRRAAAFRRHLRARRLSRAARRARARSQVPRAARDCRRDRAAPARRFRGERSAAARGDRASAAVAPTPFRPRLQPGVGRRPAARAAASREGGAAVGRAHRRHCAAVAARSRYAASKCRQRVQGDGRGTRRVCGDRRRRDGVRRDPRGADPHFKDGRRAARDEFRRPAHAKRQKPRSRSCSTSYWSNPKSRRTPAT
jgi:hypothetical protein